MLKKLLAKCRSEKGFTLIELLVVILIIGILAAIAVPVFLNQRKVAQEGALKSDLKNAALAFEQYLVTNKSYPAKTEDVPVQTSTGNHVEIPTAEGMVQKMRSASATEFIDVNMKMVLNPDPVSGRLLYASKAPVAQSFNASINTTCANGTVINSSNSFNFGPTYGDGLTSYIMSASCVGSKVVSMQFEEMYNAKFSAFTITPESGNAPAANANEFCIQGYNDNNPSNFWKYSSKDGGLLQGKC